MQTRKGDQINARAKQSVACEGKRSRGVVFEK